MKNTINKIANTPPTIFHGNTQNATVCSSIISSYPRFIFTVATYRPSKNSLSHPTSRVRIDFGSTNHGSNSRKPTSSPSMLRMESSPYGLTCTEPVFSYTIPKSTGPDSYHSLLFSVIRSVVLPSRSLSPSTVTKKSEPTRAINGD